MGPLLFPSLELRGWCCADRRELVGVSRDGVAGRDGRDVVWSLVTCAVDSSPVVVL